MSNNPSVSNSSIPEGDASSRDIAAHPAPATNDVYVAKLPERAGTPPSKPFEFAALFARYEPPDASTLPAFLQRINVRELFLHPGKLGEWSYEMRHQSQRILSYVYLGPWSVVKDRAFMQEAGISMILTFYRGEAANLNPLPSAITDAQRDLGVELHPLHFNTTQSLFSTFNEAANAINHHMAASNPDVPNAPQDLKGAVLVCCDSGNERSPVLIVAYLMQTLGLTLRFAHRLVNDLRFSIHFDHSVNAALVSYEQDLQARRIVSMDRQTFKDTDDAQAPLDPKFLKSLPDSKRIRPEESDEDTDASAPRSFTPFAG